jgi:hypothetical protein
MPDIFYLLGRWWKQMFLVIIIAVAIVAAIVFTQPSRYLSVATALPASPVLTDKANIFNNNIEELYSSLGNPDDLDRILGTAQLDTVYLAVAMNYNLWDHYKMDKKEDQVHRSAAMLKANSKVMRSEFGELKIKVWDTDKNLAPQLANAILDKLNSIHQTLQAANNLRVLEGLREGKLRLKQIAVNMLQAPLRSTIQLPDTSVNIFTVNDQLKKYDELIGEYQLTLDTNPAVLVVVEKARVSISPDKPKRFMLLVATAVLSFLFSLLLALFLERRKRRVL